jgi:hypothetical protein
VEYHFDMHRLISARDASFVVFVLLAFFFFVPALSAQINGVPASVTSIGFGGHHDRMPGVPASVTSLGPNGFQGGGGPRLGFTSSLIRPVAVTGYFPASRIIPSAGIIVRSFSQARSRFTPCLTRR